MITFGQYLKRFFAPYVNEDCEMSLNDNGTKFSICLQTTPVGLNKFRKHNSKEDVYETYSTVSDLVRECQIEDMELMIYETERDFNQGTITKSKFAVDSNFMINSKANPTLTDALNSHVKWVIRKENIETFQLALNNGI